MVLGHTFGCEDLAEAERLTKFLRKSDISARIEPVTFSQFSIRVKGTYDNIHSYLVHCREELTKDLEEEKDSIQEENADNPDDQYARLYQGKVVDAVNALKLPRYGLGV